MWYRPSCTRDPSIRPFEMIFSRCSEQSRFFGQIFAQNDLVHVNKYKWIRSRRAKYSHSAAQFQFKQISDSSAAYRWTCCITFHTVHCIDPEHKFPLLFRRTLVYYVTYYGFFSFFFFLSIRGIAEAA